MPKNILKVGLIGCGGMGEKRLEAIRRTGLGKITAVYDADEMRSKKLADTYKAKSVDEPIGIWDLCDIGIVATPHAFLAPNALVGLDAGKFVLVEKPGAIGRAELERINRPRCKIGYNHRFHPAARKIAAQLESPLWIRAAYGHGGRPGYEKEWRFQRALSGGGEILDQGVHLLDLAQYWLGEPLAVVNAIRQSAFYDSTEEDNGMVLLQSKSGVSVSLHCSASQWKNLFRVEIGSRDDLWIWEGLGTESYGAERLIRYRRNPEGGKPSETTEVFPEASQKSWDEEWRHVYGCAVGEIEKVESPPVDSLPLFELLEKIYNGAILKTERPT